VPYERAQAEALEEAARARAEAAKAQAAAVNGPVDARLRELGLIPSEPQSQED
jgi:hypothetical protein